LIDFENLPLVIGVVGSRDFPKLHWVDNFISRLPHKKVIVSGGARGVDKAAYDAAIKYGHHYKPFHVEEWEWRVLKTLVHIAEIAYIRNEALVRYILKMKGIIVIFAKLENGNVVGGSLNVKDFCEQLGVPFIVIPYENS
jgi:predicted Rossmann fold nucleotide-binding protein DprA/Smf involved in DNA uptake